MNIELLNMLGTWAGPVATFAGFIFVRNQLRAERRALETQTRWQMYDTGINVLTLFLENPDVRPYFYDGKPTPTEEPERSRVLAMAELVCDHLESVVMSRQEVEADTHDVWVRYMQGLHRRSPVMREFLALDCEGYRYSSDFLRLLCPVVPKEITAVLAPA